jgi:PqqD family protein of HPr-rel-A system
LAAYPSGLRWRLRADQRLLFEDFDDGIVMFDAGVGATHLLNVTAAEALAVILESPDLDVAEVHARLVSRLGLDERVLPVSAVEELLHRLEDLNLVCAEEL